MTIPNNNNNNNNNNNKEQQPHKKRRWYYSKPKPTTPIIQAEQNQCNDNESIRKTNDANIEASRQKLLKQYEKERLDNEIQVNKMEQQLHEFFHKTKTPYSYIDGKCIYTYTPEIVSEPDPSANYSSQETVVMPNSNNETNTKQPSVTRDNSQTNPFINITFNPFVPSNPVSLFSNPSTLWTNIFPIQIADTTLSLPQSTQTNVSSTVTPTSVQPEVINICEKIEHIDDLIALCDKYPLVDDKKYNINMTAIHAIREPLCDLSNMVGMDTIKRTIVDQILYYLQELHIPEVKKKKEQPEKTCDDPKVLNPFANPFVSSFSPANTACGAAASAPTTNSKKNPWANFISIGPDEFAAPTKGDFMHTVIYGPPGSGKTEVAKIIGRIFSNLGILNKKIFKKVSRNDLVAGYLGQTAIKTKDMIKASLGGVLFIDEAYSLGNSEKRDSFAKECIDTLCEALSEHKHNWMVIIAGYEKELNDCFFNLNEGLNSRFTWRFKLDAYKPSEMKAIYEKQVYDYGWTFSSPVVANVNNEHQEQVNTGVSAEPTTIPESWFASRMDYFTTYGRDMETLFTKTKIAHSRRVFCLPMSEKKIITFTDLENGFKLFIQNPEVNDRKEKNSGGPYMKTLYL